MSRRYASRRYAGGLGPSRVRTRIPTTRRLGQWVSLRKILRFRVRVQLSQSRCPSLLLAMSGRVFLFFPPRGHEPPPTLRDRLNPNLSLKGCTIHDCSPILVFCFLYSKILPVTKIMRLNVCFNEMALFGPFTALIKDCSSYGSNGGHPTRGDG